MRNATLTVVILAPVALLTGCAGLSPQQKMWLQEGQTAYERKQYPQGVQRLTLLINDADDPAGLSQAYYVRGMCNAMTGNRNQAYTDLQRCVELDGDGEVTWKAYVVLGTLHFEDEQWDAAGRAYGDAAGRMPPILDSEASTPAPVDRVYFRLGQCYERTGRWPQARETFASLRQHYPTSSLAGAVQRRLELNASNFAVQCGAFASPSNAAQFRGELEQKGLAAYVRPEPRGDQSIHLVLVGQYSTYEQARRGLAAVRQHVPDAILWP